MPKQPLATNPILLFKQLILYYLKQMTAQRGGKIRPVARTSGHGAQSGENRAVFAERVPCGHRAKAPGQWGDK